jgi:energy-coupling factor transport system substrate-specific component
MTPTPSSGFRGFVRDSRAALLELRDMWENTRLVVFTAISAALYAAILIPFKVLPLIPGVTEFRPANAVPVVCSLLFGPAAAWGSAIGNFIGDLFAGIGPGDFFGFLGNFLYGLVPYRAWEAISDGDPVPRSVGDTLRMLFVILVAAAGCSLVIGWGLNFLGFVPFTVLGNLVFWNNFLVAAVLGPLLLRVLHPRVRAARLLYRDLVERPRRPRAARLTLLAIGTVAILAGHVAGNLISSGRWTPPWVEPLGHETPSRALQVGVGLAPFVAVAYACFLAL